MIIVGIVGGLGNQGFGYAAGRALAEKNKDRLKQDLTSIGKDKLRKFELNKLCVIIEIATREEIGFVRSEWSNPAKALVRRGLYKQHFRSAATTRVDSDLIRPTEAAPLL